MKETGPLSRRLPVTCRPSQRSACLSWERKFTGEGRSGLDSVRSLSHCLRNFCDRIIYVCIIFFFKENTASQCAGCGRAGAGSCPGCPRIRGATWLPGVPSAPGGLQWGPPDRAEPHEVHAGPRSCFVAGRRRCSQPSGLRAKRPGSGTARGPLASVKAKAETGWRL